MRAGKLPVGLSALSVVLLLWTGTPRAAAQDEFTDEFADEFGDDTGQQEPSQPAEPAPAPSPAADEFGDEFGEDQPSEQPSGAAAGAEARGEAAVSTEELEPAVEDPEDAEDVRARRFRSHNTIEGPVGGVHVVDAASAAEDSFRMQLAIAFFFKDSFLRPEDDQDRIGGTLSVSWTVIELLELYASIRAFASNNSEGDPTLLQVLGDTRFGLKGFYDVLPWLAIGGDASVALLNTVGDIGLVGRSTSFGLRANVTADLRGLASSIPLVMRLNLQYWFDNSEELVEDVERERFQNLEDPASTFDECFPNSEDCDEFRHLVTREERFGLDINRTDFFNLGLGFEAPFRVAEDFYLSPIFEWVWNIPVNRQGYTCLFIPEDSRLSDDDSCLEDEGVSAFPMDFTLGVRVLPPIRGLSFLAAVDIAATGKSRGNLVRELAPNQPYNVILSGSYAYDTRPPDPEPVIREVEKEVVREVRPPGGRIEGQVIEQGEGTPIKDAVVRFPQQDASPIVTGDDGRFISYRFEPDEVAMEISHPEYEPGTCTATIPEPEADGAAAARAPGEQAEDTTVEVTCELVALPRKGDIGGRVVSEEGSAIGGAEVKLMGPETRTLTTDASGQFELEGVTPGTYNVRVEADDYLIKLQEFQVEPRETAQPEITLLEQPRRPLVRVRRSQIQIRRQINFATNSARIEESSYPLMHEIADVLMRNPNLKRIEIQGHTDNRGSADHNMQLSQERAASVRQWLVEHGVDGARLEAQGYGQTRPLVPNITPANRARNRRVQFMIKEREDG